MALELTIPARCYSRCCCCHCYLRLAAHSRSPHRRAQLGVSMLGAFLPVVLKITSQHSATQTFIK